MDYDTALASSEWAVKVVYVQELVSDPPRPARLFDLDTTIIKGNFRSGN